MNTNTRYLHENIVTLAERLAATTEEGLDVAYFCCSGSEANDLAAQLAKTHTKHQGCIVLSNAYHGNTTEVFQLSPEDCPKEHRKDWVKTIPGPRSFLENQSAYIQRLKEDGSINVFQFDKTALNLSGLSTKSISEPKMQETSSIKILS